MSRSCRLTPIIGITTCRSEKADKVIAHRRERRSVKTDLDRGEQPPPTGRHAFFNPWMAGKDGKMDFDPERHPRLMRK